MEVHPVLVMSEAAAKDLYEQIRDAAEQVRDRMEQLHELLVEAREGSAHIALGMPSWTAFLAAAFADQPLALDREQRRELVGYLAAEGMSIRAIAPIVGVGKSTVNDDLTPTVQNRTVEPEPVVPPPITGLNGKTYSRPITQPADAVPEHWTQDEESLRSKLTAGQAVVVSLREHHRRIVAWAEETGLLVRIDRRTPWGNPFEMPSDGDRTTVITKYRLHYLPNKPALLADLPSLAGKALACWCAPEPCHGDILTARIAA